MYICSHKTIIIQTKTIIMMKVKHLFSGMLAMLAVLLLTGCQVNDNPVRTSLEVDTSTLTLAVGESATRTATTEAKKAYQITYSSSNPAVATVDQNGKVTGVTEGEAVITVHMDETRESWYAAKTLVYNVVVKNPSAEQLANVDKATPLTLVAQADGKITVTFNNGIILANDIHYTVNGGAEQTGRLRHRVEEGRRGAALQPEPLSGRQHRGRCPWRHKSRG